MTFWLALLPPLFVGHCSSLAAGDSVTVSAFVWSINCGQVPNPKTFQFSEEPSFSDALTLSVSPGAQGGPPET